MKSYDIIVVGASAAGLTAAITARRHYPQKSIMVIRKEKLIPIPCGIPYAFGQVGTPDKNLIPADKALQKNNIDDVIGKAIDIDRKNHIIKIESGEGFVYKKFIIATGSNPMIPPIPGTDIEGVFAIHKDVPYLKEVIKAVDKANSVTIIGCGFIGVEIAEECRRRCPDIEINIVEMLSHCLQLTYDTEFSEKAEEVLRKQNIILELDETVSEIVGNGKVEKLKLKSGREIKTDFVILGIGAVANTELAEKSGLEIGPGKGVLVNHYMKTNDEDIFACGDCAEKFSFFDGKTCNMKLASIATTEARIAGANLFANRRINHGVIGVYSTVLGDECFAAAGLTTAHAKKKGIEVITGDSEGLNRHPGCMPGAARMRVKLLFEAATKRIVGGQVTGAKSGGELINAISACIQQKMTADDIATFQTGTHPALTASPIAYQLVNAAEMAIIKMREN
ncbi:MAG: FAD-dependent oxidoreductase [Candidatus Zixiibacteriota bacterium]